MACLHSNQDMESLFMSRDKDFQVVLDNIKQYKDIVFIYMIFIE